MRETLSEYCKRTGLHTLLEQWDQQANAPLTPDSISHGSKRKVWWRCEKGHRWQAAVHTRTGSGTGCPVCAGKIPLAGETDLATLYPDLALQWDFVKNGSLTPSQVLPGSHRIVWWVCEKGHRWQAQIKSRVAGCGCPVCANREILPGQNDLATLFPQLARQWHFVKNGPLTPEMVSPGTTRKVWWICEMGHEWQASVSSRTGGGCGCPVCTGRKTLSGFNDLATLFPHIAEQWHPTLNGELLPQQVTPGSNRKGWWVCELGHEYPASVAARTAGSGCPYCAGKKVLPGFNDLATLEPEVARQWHPTLNGALTLESVTAGSRRKVWWTCGQGHIWKAAIYSRSGPRKSGCPICSGRFSRTRLERYLHTISQGNSPAAISTE